MINDSLKDFNYDFKEYKDYRSKHQIKDTNKVIRQKWNLYLHGLVTQKNILKREDDYVLTLKRKY